MVRDTAIQINMDVPTIEHIQEFSVREHDGALHQILKVWVHTPTHTSIQRCPLSSGHINVITYLQITH